MNRSKTMSLTLRYGVVLLGLSLGEGESMASGWFGSEPTLPETIGTFVQKPPLILEKNLNKEEGGSEILNQSVTLGVMPQEYRTILYKKALLPLNGNDEEKYEFEIASYSLSYSPTTIGWGGLGFASLLLWNTSNYLITPLTYTVLVALPVVGVVAGGYYFGGTIKNMLSFGGEQEKGVDSSEFLKSGEKIAKSGFSFLQDKYLKNKMVFTKTLGAIMKEQRIDKLSPSYSENGKLCIYKGEIPCGLWTLNYDIQLKPLRKEGGDYLK